MERDISDSELSDDGSYASVNYPDDYYQEGLDPYEDIECEQEPHLPNVISVHQECSIPTSSDENHYPHKRALDSSSMESPQLKIPKLAIPSSTERKTLSKQPWKTEKDPDEAPANLKFAPARQPGVQLEDPSCESTPLDLFKLFFSKTTVETICDNTNKQAAINIKNGKKYKWEDVTIVEFYKFIGLVLFIGQLKLNKLIDYWRNLSIFSVLSPNALMSRDRYRVIARNIHLSDPGEAAVNYRTKKSFDCDRLFRIKPLMNEICHACRSNYHPRKNLSIHERLVPLNAKKGLLADSQTKSINRDFKMFVLTDSSNGYTVDCVIFSDKATFPNGYGMAYDAVMSLMRPSFLGSGYHLYLDNFFSSPKLFKDLLVLKMGACGTMLEGRRGFPRSEENALTKKSPRGSLRWMREGSLLFVKWKDTREVSTASTIHQAYGGDTVDRRVKNKDGSWTLKSIPVPAPVLAYDQHKKSVNSSDQMNQYFSDQPGIMGGYNFLFFHFLDMAVTNSYGIHVELCKKDTTAPMTRHAFIEELTTTLCGMTITLRKELKWRNTRLRRKTTHVPVLVEMPIPVRKQSYVKKVLKRCLQCKKNGVNIDSQWKCQECQVALCINPDRKCFHEWHQ
ncbi:piggyBac transposable element-derived protein 4 isoform X1 [Esox lucius]|uniref:PiggyBac transposable element-derived protein domain-containing protein n=1 Tax=Esox lucius TaxID=8010 RepID=A0A3P9AAI6_ESOLU|nr:piggyBac transposable element-derived protein 4 isoform X1 [Esox lucius]